MNELLILTHLAAATAGALTGWLGGPPLARWIAARLNRNQEPTP